MSWHDKHEQDQDRKTDEAIMARARSYGGCGRCAYSRNFRQTLTGILLDCPMLYANLTTVSIDKGNTCSHQRS